MIIETCFLLWCETEDPRICTVQRVHHQLYSEHTVGKDFRNFQYCINGEIEVKQQKLKEKLGCWLERTND